MKIIFRGLVLCLFPKLSEILNTRDRLYKENLELRERLEFLGNSTNNLSEGVGIKSGIRSQCSCADAEFSVKVYDSETIPSKN